MMKKKILGFAVLFLAAWQMQAQTVFTDGTWEEIREKARAENKYIFVDLYFEGCMPCAEMDKKVFPDEAVGNLLNAHFVNFKTDVFKEEIGMRLSMKYAVSGYPTYLFMTPDGHSLGISSGFTGVERFVPLLEQVLEQASLGLVRSFSPELDMDYPDFYREHYTERKRLESREPVNAFMNSREDLTDELSFVVMTRFPVEQKYVTFYIDSAHVLAGKYGRMPVRNRLSNLVAQEGTRLGREGDAAGFDRIVEHIATIFPGRDWGIFSPGFFKAYYDASLDAAWMLHKLETQADTYKDWQDKSNVLAKVIIDSKDQPEVLRQLAARYDAALSDGDVASVDLYKAGLIHLYLGEYDRAVAYAKQAKEVHKYDYFLKGEDITALLGAAEAGGMAGFEPKVAVLPKPMRMD